MPCGVWSTTGVSDANLGIVVSGYKLDHPEKIETTKQADGSWTVTATFPPCADAKPDNPPLSFAEIKEHLSIASISERLSTK